MRSRDLAAKLPSTGRRLSFQWKIAAAITFVIAVASITLSTVMHQTFSHNQEDAARAAADRNLQLVLQDETGSMRALFRATTEGRDVPEELRQAVAGGTPAELMRSGAENQLRFRAPRMLDLSLLIAALPESYRATETTPGEYLIEGRIDPQVLATVTAWCARLDVLATDMRVEQRSLEDVFLDVTGRELRQ